MWVDSEYGEGGGQYSQQGGTVREIGSTVIRAVQSGRALPPRAKRIIVQSRHTLDPGGSIAEKSGDGGQGVNTHIHTCSSCLINERASREKDVMGGSGDKGATHTHTHTFSSCLISAILMGPSTARSLSRAPRQPALLELGRPLRKE